MAIAQAELDVLTAQQALDEIYETSQMATAEALKAVEDAETALEDLKASQLQQAEALQAVAEAQEALKTAYSSYNGTRSAADDNTIAEAYAELVLAKADLRDIQEKFDDYYKKPDDDLEKAALQLKLSAAQSAYDEAARYYNAVTGTGSEVDLATTAAEVAVAEAQLADAQREYERVKDGPTPGEIAVAEATLALAQTDYETLKDGPDPAEVALAEATLANARAELEVAKEEQAVIDLQAPIDGTILSIDASVGESVGSGAIITLADLSQPVLTVYLDETDMGMVEVGYEAEVIFDSLPDSTFTGHVVSVDPSLQTVSNVDTIVAQVKLDADSEAISLPVGSNASVDVIGGRVENAVLVPVEAIREIDTGEYAVFVMEDGEPKLRVVTVGLMDYTSAAITSGLEAGEIVTTGVAETTQSSSDTSSSTTRSLGGEMQPPTGGEMMPPP
jgi:RND family efflux transporter MFP subunit